MRRVVCFAFFSCVLVSCPLLHAQADTQSAALLQAALKAFGGGTVNDITLSASARRIAGSTDQTVPGTFKALASGSIQLTFQTTPGALIETRSVAANGLRTGSWTDPQGRTHALAYHNLLTEPAWFSPVLTVARALNSSGGLTVSYVGAEAFRGIAVQHLRLTAAGQTNPTIQALTQTEFYLDAGTLLPVGFAYNDHPDNTITIDIPVEVLLSTYQVMDGLLLPTHIQQFRNNSLCLDLQILSAQLNTGLVLNSSSAE